MRGSRLDSLHKNAPAGTRMLPPKFSSAGAGHGGFVLEHHRQRAFDVPPLSSTVCGVSVSLGASCRAEVTRGGRRRLYRLTRGDVCVFPQGFSVDGARVGACEFLLLWLHPSVVERAASHVAQDGRAEIAPRIGAADPLAAKMLDDLLSELKAGTDGDGLYVQSLVDALAAHLVRHYSATPREQAGGVPGYVLTSAIAFIDESLGRDVSLAEVAQAAGLSPPRFARAFKAATGRAVREYVDERRVEKAKPLLAAGEMTTEEIARRVGFRSPRRFAAVFRKLTGVPPQSFRQRKQS